jgi:hypothetical protein
LCLGVVGLFLNFSFVIFDKDQVVRIFRVILVVRVVTCASLSPWLLESGLLDISGFLGFVGY